MRTITATRAACDRARAKGRAVGFVPTMGAFHEGHRSLMRRARDECDETVVSIFVNPLQFGDARDLQTYPRDEESDLADAERVGVDLVFAPSADEMYPRGEPEVTVDPGPLGERFEGASRPGHFRGVATVVAKLFDTVGACSAYFGEKDAQQLAIVRRVVADLNLPVAIASVATVREADGLALSSRNRHLSRDERRLAPALYQALRAVRDQVAAGTTDASLALSRAAATIPEHSGLRLEYLELVDPASFQPVARIAGPVIAAGALWVGGTRLIDNVLCSPTETLVS
jgi:pantoate--beta-alanine ligase